MLPFIKGVLNDRKVPDQVIFEHVPSYVWK
jgi:hypothetical protein